LLNFWPKVDDAFEDGAAPIERVSAEDVLEEAVRVTEPVVELVGGLVARGCLSLRPDDLGGREVVAVLRVADDAVRAGDRHLRRRGDANLHALQRRLRRRLLSRRSGTGDRVEGRGRNHACAEVCDPRAAVRRLRGHRLSLHLEIPLVDGAEHAGRTQGVAHLLDRVVQDLPCHARRKAL